MKWSYNNRWVNYLNYAMIILITLLCFILVLGESSISQTAKLYLYFFGINVFSMVITALFVLSYIHYKSPNNYIILDEDCIIFPKSTVLPDSIYIPYEQIIYDDHYNDKGREKYQLVYNGGSVLLDKQQMKDQDKWSDLIYNLKEMIR